MQITRYKKDWYHNMLYKEGSSEKFVGKDIADLNEY